MTYKIKFYKNGRLRKSRIATTQEEITTALIRNKRFSRIDVEMVSDNPFAANNQNWVKRTSSECEVSTKIHNYGVRKNGHCFDCHSPELKQIKTD